MDRRTRGRVPATLGCLAIAAGCSSTPSTDTAPLPPSIGSASVGPATSPPALSILLSPVCDAGGEPVALDVEVSLERWPVASEAPSFRIRDEQTTHHAIGDIITAERIEGPSGEVAVTRTESTDKYGQKWLVMQGSRAIDGPVTARYRVRSVPATDKGIRFGLRNDEFGMGGAAGGFLAGPALDDPHSITVTWKKAAASPCKEDLGFMSALGEGVGPHRHVASADALRQAGFFYARGNTVAIDDGSMHLRFTFIGKPSFDVPMAAKFAGDALRAERAAFSDNDPTTHYAFMRVLPEMTTKVTGGGNPYGYSSVVGPEAPFNLRMRNHIAHELCHHWIGVGLWLRDAEGVSGYWFSEGFTVHYADVIPLRAGLITPSELLESVNKISSALYASPHRGASNATIEQSIEKNLGDSNIGLIPYYRGALYAAELDASIRVASKSKRSLDDLIHDLFAKAKTAPKNENGYPQLPDSVFRDAVAKELGEAGRNRFDAVIRRGELPRPPPTAYGPCFEGKPKKYGEGELAVEALEWVRVEGVPDARCAEAPSPTMRR